MDMQALFIFQIFADAVLGIAVLFVFLRIRRTMSEAQPVAISSGQLVEFQKSLEQSRDEAAHFFRKLDESFAKFQELATSLEGKEERLNRLVEEVRIQCARLEELGRAGEEQAREPKYQKVLQLRATGLSSEEIAERSGLTVGEVALIVNLENSKKEAAD